MRGFCQKMDVKKDDKFCGNRYENLSLQWKRTVILRHNFSTGRDELMTKKGPLPKGAAHFQGFH